MNRRLREILKVAARMFAELGYERTTLEMIAEELDLSKPGLYYYVKSKEDVLAQILEDIIQRTIERVQADVAPMMSPDERLRQLIVAHVLSLCVYPEGRAFTLHQGYLLGRIPPEIRDLRDRYEQSVREIIIEGIDKHIFHVADAKLATFTLLGALNWIPLWYSPDGVLSPEEIGESTARLLVGGLTSPLGLSNEIVIGE